MVYAVRANVCCILKVDILIDTMYLCVTVGGAV